MMAFSSPSSRFSIRWSGSRDVLPFLHDFVEWFLLVSHDPFVLNESDVLLNVVSG